jgi:hypothetical protein
MSQRLSAIQSKLRHQGFLPPLFSSITGTVSPVLTDIPLSLDYPSLFSPLVNPKVITVTLLLGLSCLPYRNFPSNIWQYIFSRIKKNAIKIIATIFSFLLINQEIQLERRLITDFTPITKGFLSKVDGIALHYIGTRPNTALTDSTRVHMFHGFGANCLSWQPILKLFNSVSINAIAHDFNGFGFNPRRRDNTENAYFPSIYRPLWNTMASLKIRFDKGERDL